VAGVVGLWLGDTLYFVSGPGTRKSRNLATDPRCSFAISLPDLDLVLEGAAISKTTDDHADLLTGLDAATRNAIYHEEGDAALTRSDFVAPIVRLLRDGALDGSPRTFPDPDETATVLYTQISYTYLHLRHEHRWPAERATRAVTELALQGIESRRLNNDESEGQP
jgi:hypothetical protein